jgi:hypothetical protein
LFTANELDENWSYPFSPCQVLSLRVKETLKAIFENVSLLKELCP